MNLENFKNLLTKNIEIKEKFNTLVALEIEYGYQYCEDTLDELYKDLYFYFTTRNDFKTNTILDVINYQIAEFIIDYTLEIDQILERIEEEHGINNIEIKEFFCVSKKGNYIQQVIKIINPLNPTKRQKDNFIATLFVWCESNSKKLAS